MTRAEGSSSRAAGGGGIWAGRSGKTETPHCLQTESARSASFWLLGRDQEDITEMTCFRLCTSMRPRVRHMASAISRTLSCKSRGAQ